MQRCPGGLELTGLGEPARLGVLEGLGEAALALLRRLGEALAQGEAHLLQ